MSSRDGENLIGRPSCSPPVPALLRLWRRVARGGTTFPRGAAASSVERL